MIVLCAMLLNFIIVFCNLLLKFLIVLLMYIYIKVSNFTF